MSTVNAIRDIIRKNKLYNAACSNPLLNYIKHHIKGKIVWDNKCSRCKSNKTRSVYGKCYITVNHATLSHNCIENYGRDNVIFINESTISNTTFEIRGDNNIFRIDEGGLIRDAHILLSGDGNCVDIGKNFDSGKGFRILCLEGRKVSVGDDCMFSTHCELRTSDDHSILDYMGKRINSAEDTVIGNHVWFGENVVCLKGTQVPDGSVVGHSSICTSKMGGDAEFCICWGSRS